MKNFLSGLAIFVFSVAMLYNFFGPVLIGVFSLFGAAYSFYGRVPSKILGFIFIFTSLTCYAGVVHWGWGAG